MKEKAKDKNILEEYEGKCRIINGIFIAFVLLTFTVFIVLLKKVERGAIHFIIAGLLIGVALLYKFTDGKMKERKLAIAEQLAGRDGSGLHKILRTLLYDNDRGEIKKFFFPHGKNISFSSGRDFLLIKGVFGEANMSFSVGREHILMEAEKEGKVFAVRKTAYKDIGTPEGAYKIFSEFISRNY